MLSREKCCDILGVPPDASYDEAKQAYRDLASILHPDKHAHDDRIKSRSEEKFKQLLNAWDDFKKHYKDEDHRRKKQEERDNLKKERQEREAAQQEERNTNSKDRIIRCPNCNKVNTIYLNSDPADFYCRICKVNLDPVIGGREARRREERRREAIRQEAIRQEEKERSEKQRNKKEYLEYVERFKTFTFILFCSAGLSYVTIPFLLFFILPLLCLSCLGLFINWFVGKALYD